MEKSDTARWWRLTTQIADDVETLTLLAMENGAGGCQIIDGNSALVFVNGGRTAAESVSNFLLANGASSVAIVPEAEINWVARCQEVWQPIKVGQICVVPIVDRDTITLDQTPEAPDLIHEIRLIPNTAFGTGHHESTQQILKLLQHPRFAVRPPADVFDIGTGTGVLAFAASLLFPTATVVALDVDPGSVERAVENRQLNPKCTGVKFLGGTFDERFHKFDLITANIYAEILIDYEPLFFSHLNAGGVLILAGILDELAPQLEQIFAVRFKLLEKLSQGEWMAYLMEKKYGEEVK